ncbi:PGL/p-HBAD biosynthesis glycosyltransferase [bacterium HR36]|nr:PGL/p-HBAD biosynthesis glycosyltransferase [bacterium HR36]
MSDPRSEGFAAPGRAWLTPPEQLGQHVSEPTTRAFSVIIPTYNEAASLAAAIYSARRSGAGEIVVVDGGSTDATCTLAAQLADRLLQTAPGRATQMNVGAHQARGDWLCFLHADCLLTPQALRQAARYLSRDGVAAACFRQYHLRRDWRFRCLDAGACARVRCLGLAYGDQGLVLARRLFHRIGGFPEMPIFEDAALCRKLQAYGKILVLPCMIYVSPRRWHARSFWGVTLTNWFLLAAWCLGVPHSWLARFRPPYTQPSSPKRT